MITKISKYSLLLLVLIIHITPSMQKVGQSVNLFESVGVVTTFNSAEAKSPSYLLQIKPSRPAVSTESRWFPISSSSNYSMSIFNALFVYDLQVVKIVEAFLPVHREDAGWHVNVMLDSYLTEWYKNGDSFFQRFETLANIPSVEVPVSHELIYMATSLLRRIFTHVAQIRDIFTEKPKWKKEYLKKLYEVESQIGITWSNDHKERLLTLAGEVADKADTDSEPIEIFGENFYGISRLDVPLIALASYEKDDLQKTRLWLEKATKISNYTVEKNEQMPGQVSSNVTLDTILCGGRIGDCVGGQEAILEQLFLEIMQKTSNIMKMTPNKGAQHDHLPEICNKMKTIPHNKKQRCKYHWTNSAIFKKDVATELTTCGSGAESEPKNKDIAAMEISSHWLIPKKIEVVLADPKVTIYHHLVTTRAAGLLKRMTFPVFRHGSKTKEGAVSRLSPTFWSEIYDKTHSSVTYLRKKIAYYTGLDENKDMGTMSHVLVYTTGHGSEEADSLRVSDGNDGKGSLLLNLNHHGEIRVVLPELDLSIDLDPGSAVYWPASMTSKAFHPVICPSSSNAINSVFLKKMEQTAMN